MADDVVCSLTPEPFGSAEDWYEVFAAPTDDEVRDLLQRAARELPTSK
jgi:putative phosphoribosyl transferase